MNTLIHKILFPELLKWWQTIKVLISIKLAYRLDFFLTVIIPAVSFFFIKLSLWKTAYISTSSEFIAGYSLTQMMEYQFWALIVGFLTNGYLNEGISEDIRRGKISPYLIRPFDFWKHQVCHFISFQTLQLLPATIALSLFFFLFKDLSLDFFDFLKGFTICVFSSILWFLIRFCIGLVTFWMEETWSISSLIVILAHFFSGSYFPLDIFPPALISILKWTPFPYMTYVPINYFQEKGGNLILDLSIISCWIFLFVLFQQFLWKKGIKHYAGAGI